MPALDEGILSELMHRATNDLHARPAVAAGVAARQRGKQRRTRALAVTATGVAAAMAVGVAATTTGGGAGPRPATPRITVTAAQRALNHLSLVAAITKLPAGRYVKMAELQGNDKRTTVIDSRTGDIWTFQSGPGIPSSLSDDRHGSTTSAQFAAYPTTLAGLRSLLVAQARHDLAIGLRFELRALAERAALDKKEAKDFQRIKRTLLAAQPKENRNDLIFSQAAYMLWNPLVGPSLRSALFKVLAATPGVVVNSHARDSIGRPAVEISRFDRAARYTEAIFESPDASRVLETVSIHPATKASDGLPAEAGYSLNDTYLSITWTNTLPTKNPYRG